MTKQEILEKLYEKKGAEADDIHKEQIDHICNLLEALPDFNIDKKIPEINRYLNGDISRLDGDILKTILDKLKGQISEVESRTIESMNKTKKRLLIGFLIVIGILALCAFVFTILNFIYKDEDWGGLFGKIANAFGLLDFVVGAIGFIWERIEDLKKSELQSAAQIAKETGDTDKFVQSVIKNSFNTIIKPRKWRGDYVSGNKYTK